MLLLPCNSYFLYVICKFKVSWLCCLKIDYLCVLFKIDYLCVLFVAAINRGEIKDTDMEAIMDTIVDSLFSVFATLGKHFSSTNICISGLKN